MSRTTARSRAGETGVRTLFTLLLVMVCGGLAYFTALGLMHR
ncbi:hypothetical protein [Streptomyces sp. enrichment culture]